MKNVTFTHVKDNMITSDEQQFVRYGRCSPITRQDCSTFTINSQFPCNNQKTRPFPFLSEWCIVYTLHVVLIMNIVKILVN
jgi:hypothetical protein